MVITIILLDVFADQIIYSIVVKVANYCTLVFTQHLPLVYNITLNVFRDRRIKNYYYFGSRTKYIGYTNKF